VKTIKAILFTLELIFNELKATHKAIDELALRREEEDKKKKYEDYTNKDGLYGRGRK
jgi:hypothetical protein